MIEKKWYAVYTRVRWEKKVSELLTKRNIENYCPLNKIQRQWADRKKIVAEPIFTSYVFARGTESDILQMKKTEGVLNMVYWLGKPAVIRDGEIEMIRNFLHEHAHVTLEKSVVNVNDNVRIISGPLLNYQGQVVAVKSNTVKLVLPSLGFSMSAVVERTHVQLIKDDVHFLNKGVRVVGL